jgi:hypothetical protein
MALLDMWRANRDGIREKSVHQILAFAGEGKLSDGNTCSNEFRDLLRVVPLDILQRYSSEALNGDADEPGLALQDIVNEAGFRLGYGVDPGLYRGRQGESGHDGLWRDRDIGHTIVAEVKSSSNYRIKLEPIAKRRDLLNEHGKLDKEQSSVLIVICQLDDDTTDLEAQIRGSRYSWQVRVISLEALFKMVALKSATDDPASAKLLRGILIPREFTKLDALLDIVSFVAEDVSSDEEEEEEEADEEDTKDLDGGREGAYVSKLNKTELRAQAKEFFLKRLHQNLREISRTKFETEDGRTAICYAPSQPYQKATYTQYWFGLHDHQVEFMDGHPEGYAAYLCAGAGLLFMPWNIFSKYVEHMGESSTGNRHWRHVVLQRAKGGAVRMRLRGDAPGNPVDVSKWFFELTSGAQ